LRLINKWRAQIFFVLTFFNPLIFYTFLKKGFIANKGLDQQIRGEVVVVFFFMSLKLDLTKLLLWLKFKLIALGMLKIEFFLNSILQQDFKIFSDKEI
tara:strand:- start:644 stop:937 length:294 start_codon:yes stop_codon:yes gene_type:complete